MVENMSDYFVRELAKSDLSSINKWRNDRELISSLVSTFRYIAENVDAVWLESYFSSRTNSVRLAICDKSSGAIVGAVYLLAIDWIARSCEFGIWVGEREFQGKGVGTFATRKALEHAFFDLNLNRVYLTVLESNERALALYKKIGFVVEGVMRNAAFKEGVYANLVQMSIMKAEFSGTAD